MEAEDREVESRDLLRRFAGSTSLADPSPPAAPPPVSPAGEEVELSLGLSLGGCFSSEPKEEKKLVRSSSISFFTFFDENFPKPPPPPLARTCSLPAAGAEEDYRKRKELQSLKRLEAKRKRSSKRNSSKSEDFSGCPWVPGSTHGLPGSTRTAARLPPVSQGSIGSQGSYSPGPPEFDCRQSKGFNIAGTSGCSEAKSHLTTDQTNQKAYEDALKSRLRGNGMGEKERSMMEDMPCVSTKGDGPNGRRVEGFLYKYGKGEEVRIVCVCHGSFLTPAEFVRHAGGGDVDHPLRHIVVSTSPSTFLSS